MLQQAMGIKGFVSQVIQIDCSLEMFLSPYPTAALPISDVCPGGRKGAVEIKYYSAFCGIQCFPKRNLAMRTWRSKGTYLNALCI